MQLAFPGMSVPLFGVVSPAEYNALVTNHGTIMIFWVAMPVLIAAFGNYLIPLMVGCDDMVFPKINRSVYQVFLLSAVVLIVLVLRRGRRVRRRVDGLPAAVCEAGVQPDAIGSSMWVVASPSSSWPSCWAASTSSRPR